jgi:hypothetical protein
LIGPIDTRITRLTSAPCRSKSWRTSLPLAARATSAYQRFAASLCASLDLRLSIFMRVARSIFPDSTPAI